MDGIGAEAPPVVVLDTNVVLDWLLFMDRRMDALRTALEGGRLRWVTCHRMREEFRRTLSSPALAQWQPDTECLLISFDRQANLLPEPLSSPLHPRCDDPHDQMFVDLALASGARWLLSHDKALLRLRRRMPPQGPQICRPDDWTAR